MSSANDEQLGRQLVEAVYADPDDDGPRLVYADWLVERGDPRGEFIHLDIRLSHSWDPELEERRNALLDLHGEDWVAPFGHELGGIYFHRGFPLSYCTTKDLPDDLDALFERLRIWNLSLFFRNSDQTHVRTLSQNDRLRFATLLSLSRCLRPAFARTLFASPHLYNLVELELRDCELKKIGLRALCRSHLPSLRIARINSLRSDQMAEFARWAALDHLVELDLQGSFFGDTGLTHLCESSASHLEVLRLGWHSRLREGTGQTVARMHLPSLRTLSIRGFAMTDDEAAGLATARFLPQLTRLEISKNGSLTPIGRATLVDAGLDPAAIVVF